MPPHIRDAAAKPHPFPKMPHTIVPRPFQRHLSKCLTDAFSKAGLPLALFQMPLVTFPNHLLLFDLLLLATEQVLLARPFNSFVSSLAPFTTFAVSTSLQPQLFLAWTVWKMPFPKLLPNCSAHWQQGP